MISNQKSPDAFREKTGTSQWGLGMKLGTIGLYSLQMNNIGAVDEKIYSYTGGIVNRRF